MVRERRNGITYLGIGSRDLNIGCTGSESAFLSSTITVTLTVSSSSTEEAETFWQWGREVRLHPLIRDENEYSAIL